MPGPVVRPARVVNLHRDAYDVYGGRPGKGQTGFWGNPFSWRKGTPPEFLVANREEAISKHKPWFRAQPEKMHRLPELAGQRIGCFCRPARCHGDNYLDFLEELGYPVIRN